MRAEKRILSLTLSSFFVGALAHAACDSLPKTIYFRERQATYNDAYDFAVDKGNICYRARAQSEQKWEPLSLLPEMQNEIGEISSDDRYLIAIGRNRQIYTMKKSLSDHPRHFHWSKRWGAPLGKNKNGMFLPKDTVWDISYISPKNDKFYLDAKKREHILGDGVTTLYALMPGGRHIVYLDPWLPGDTSYEVCGPIRGRLKSKGLSASGSTLMAMDQNGNIFTRRYDFDMVGGDTFFFRYSYNNESHHTHHQFLNRLFSARALPIPDWIQLPKIQGEITNRITVEKVGQGGQHRKFKVEGKMNTPEKNQNGYFELTHDFISNSNRNWNFIETGEELKGEPIAKMDELDLGDDEGIPFQGKISEKHGISAKLVAFNPHCSPADMEFHFSDARNPLLLKFHTTETIRLTTRDGDLDQRPLKLHGAIEVPQEVLNSNLSPKQKWFIEKRLGLGKKRFTEFHVHMSGRKIEMHKMHIKPNKRFKWELVRD